MSQICSFTCAYISNVTGVRTLNAHNYRVEVTVSASDRVSPVIIPFEELQECIESCLPDKHFLYDMCTESGPELDVVRALKNCAIPTKGFASTVTAETIVNRLARDIQNELDSNDRTDVLVRKVKLREDSNSYATWSR